MNSKRHIVLKEKKLCNISHLIVLCCYAHKQLEKWYLEFRLTTMLRLTPKSLSKWDMNTQMHMHKEGGIQPQRWKQIFE